MLYKSWDDDVTSMNKALAKENRTSVMEVYSPKRVDGMAEILGLLPGMSLDSSEVDVDGKPWDFNFSRKGTRPKQLCKKRGHFC